jgi:two-component sensor histidine kinase
LTNCLRHAFPEGRTGSISVFFGCTEGLCTMTAANDGISFPDALDPVQATSMGLRLVKLLVEQLHGTLHVERANGTRFIVSFPQ